jgi:hypothetical protein
MSIVLDEHSWAEEVLRTHELGKKPFETLTRVARYYMDEGYTKKRTKKLLELFMFQCDPIVSIPKWANAINGAIDTASRRDAVCIDGIGISSSELARIGSLETSQMKRLAFTLLCLSKYWDAVGKNDGHWVNTKDSEIMKMANIVTSIKRQSAMYSSLKERGMIGFSKKVDNTNVCVLFGDSGPAEMLVTDFRNLGYQYLKHYGGPYFECQNCGITTKYNDSAKSRNQKYCRQCAAEVTMRNNVNSVMKLRSVSSKKSM